MFGPTRTAPTGSSPLARGTAPRALTSGEGARFIRDHMIRVQERAFDANMQAQGIDEARNRKVLGL